jgi:hypothetical protein
MNQVTATSSTTTTHAHAGVVFATNDNCVDFQISTQAFDDRTRGNFLNDFFHFLTGLYFPLLADRDLAPFSSLMSD